MIKRRLSEEELQELRAIAKLQFHSVSEEFIPDDVIAVISPSTYKIRYLLYRGKNYLSLRASDYRLLLHIMSGVKLHDLLPEPLSRVYVNPKYSRFIIDGGNVFSKHVVFADPGIKPGDEVLVVEYGSGKLLGVGKSVKPGFAISFHSWGEAVRIRETIADLGDAIE
ncbi:MAG: PUA domain-containing protein [Thermoprotei archaeon]